MTEYRFRVADFPFAIRIPDSLDVETLLPSFRPFRTEAEEPGTVLFRLRTVDDLPAGEGEVWEESTNDMGWLRLLRVADGYRVEIRFTADGPLHVMRATADFTEVDAAIRWDDPYAGEVLCSMLRITFAQTVTAHGAVSVHAAAVERGGRAYLFMGKSGTGKSTHAALWRRHLPGTSLLNDDNPTLRLCADGTVRAYGTPWSGKTPCYRNLSYPVAGIVRLRQAPANRFLARQDVTAFMTLLPGCSAIRQDRRMAEHLYDVLTHIAERVKVGELECLPDADAAATCHAALTAQTE